MWSRRKFIFSTLTGLGLWANLSAGGALAFSRRLGKSANHNEFTLVVGEYWSPAIAGDFIGVFDGDLCCILDEFGRLVTANILPVALHSRIFPILGRVDNLGTKVLDFKVLPKSAIALVWNQTSGQPVGADSVPPAGPNRHARLHRPARAHQLSKTDKGEETGSQEGQFGLTMISLTQPRAPHIVATIDLPDYSELHTFALDRSFVCLAGVDTSGKNKVSLYKLKEGRKPQLELLASVMPNAAIKNIILADRNLLIVQDTPTRKVSVVDISDIYHPEIVRTVELPGEDSQLVCCGSLFALSQLEESSCVVKIGNVKDFPQAISTSKIKSLRSVDSMAMNEQCLMVLGKSGEEGAVIPFSIDNNHKLSEHGKIKLAGPIDMDSDEMKSKLVLGKNNAFISSGWEGVQVLSTSRKGSWTASARFSVPKLPVAGLVAWSNYLILAGTDLRLYDLTRPEQPKLVNVSKLPTTLKQMIAAGSYILCLDKNGVTLRKAEAPQKILANLKMSAKQLSFDTQTKKAYLIQDAGKQDKDQQQSTKLLQVNVYSDNLETGTVFTVADDAYCSSAHGGYLLVGSLNGLSLYKADQEIEQICKREFQNLAWREIILRDEKIFATAVDHNASGFFLTMSFDGSEISLLETIKIPHDGVALAVKDNQAFTVGQDINGRNLLVAIDLSDLAKPNIISVKPVLESASSVTLTNNLAIVSGRGFEIFSFSS